MGVTGTCILPGLIRPGTTRASEDLSLLTSLSLERSASWSRSFRPPLHTSSKRPSPPDSSIAQPAPCHIPSSPLSTDTLWSHLAHHHCPGTQQVVSKYLLNKQMRESGDRSLPKGNGLGSELLSEVTTHPDHFPWLSLSGVRVLCAAVSPVPARSQRWDGPALHPGCSPGGSHHLKPRLFCESDGSAICLSHFWRNLETSKCFFFTK